MFRRRIIALLATLLVALTALPAVATAMPARDGGPVRYGSVDASQPAPTVVRTVVKEEALRVLPIVLAGAALLIAVGGTAVALRHVPPLQH